MRVVGQYPRGRCGRGRRPKAKSQSQSQRKKKEPSPTNDVTWRKLLVCQKARQHAVGVRQGAWHSPRHTHTYTLLHTVHCCFFYTFFKSIFFLSRSVLFLFLCASWSEFVFFPVLVLLFFVFFLVLDCIQNLCCVGGRVCVCVCVRGRSWAGLGQNGRSKSIIYKH